jgi:hypothetical protein
VPRSLNHVVSALVLILVTAVPAVAQNLVQRENMKPGSSDWTLTRPAANREIEGYASATSVNRGEQIRLYVSTSEPSYTIDVFRMGWYGGLGGRKVLGPIHRTGILQPTPAPDAVTGLIECNWTDPYVIDVPGTEDHTDWASGVYLAKLTSGTTGSNAYIVFVVRDDARPSAHNFQSSVTTYQAYNNWGGKSLYAFNSTNAVPAVKVSFNRPYAGSGSSDFRRWEYSMLRFLEREGYDVTYSTSIDTHARPDLLLQHRDFLSIGHDEYWSWEMRANVENARDHGVNLGFFSANTCYWQIRLQPSAIDPSQPNRTIVAYKEAYTQDPYYTDNDPSNDKRVTSAWRGDPVNESEDAMIGVRYIGDPVDADIVIDDVTSAPWVFENTGLTRGSRLPGLLGYEVDKIGPFSPPSVIRLGHSPFTTQKTNPAQNFSDFSDMTVYTAASGASVFATGSIQWAWGLDDWNASQNGDRTNEGARQITRNVLRRFAGAASSADCQFLPSPATRNAPGTGGTDSFTLTTQCAWTAAPDVAWITNVSPSSGSGNAAISYTLAPNNGPPRTGHIHVGDRDFTIVQASGCTFSFAPGSATSPATGGTSSFTLTPSNPACTWVAMPNASWITINGAASGTGSGQVSYTVAANPGNTRSSGISVNGSTFPISQSNGCTYSVDNTSFSLGADGGTQSVSITTDATCFWSASVSSSAPWLTIIGGASGQGSGTTTFRATPNSGEERVGRITVAGIAVTVTQAGTATNQGAKLYLVTPCRVVDTRSTGGPLPQNTSRTLTLTSTCGIPADAKAVIANLTAVGSAGDGWLTVYPADVPMPAVSTLNYRAGKTRANNAVFVPSPDGRITIYNSSTAPTHFLIDVSGYMK